MKRVFVDTGGWYANLVAEDRDHARALALFQQASAHQWKLVTSSAVIYETHALLLNRAPDSHHVALKFLDMIDAGLARVVRVTRARPL